MQVDPRPGWRDSEIDAACARFHWLDRESAIKAYEQEIAEGLARTARREEAKAEKEKLESERAARARWEQHNPTLETLAEGFLRVASDSEPPAPTNYHNVVNAEGIAAEKRRVRNLDRFVGMLLVEIRKLGTRVAELEAAASQQ